MTSSKLKKSDQHTHDMTQIEGGHIDDRVGAVPGPDSVNRRVSGPGTEPENVTICARINRTLFLVVMLNPLSLGTMPASAYIDNLA